MVILMMKCTLLTDCFGTTFPLTDLAILVPGHLKKYGSLYIIYYLQENQEIIVHSPISCEGQSHLPKRSVQLLQTILYNSSSFNRMKQYTFM